MKKHRTNLRGDFSKDRRAAYITAKLDGPLLRRVRKLCKSQNANLAGIVRLAISLGLARLEK